MHIDGLALTKSMLKFCSARPSICIVHLGYCTQSPKLSAHVISYSVWPSSTIFARLIDNKQVSPHPLFKEVVSGICQSIECFLVISVQCFLVYLLKIMLKIAFEFIKSVCVPVQLVGCK